MKRTPLPPRKPRKRRAPHTGCAECRNLRFITISDRGYCAKHYADKLVGDAVKLRDGGCRRCGSQGPLDWAHVHSRRYKSIRWYAEAFPETNSLALCRTCHSLMTYRLVEWETWCRDAGIPWDDLRRRALDDPPERPLDVIARYEAA